MQIKACIYIDYRDGMLDEILKHVDESKIEGIERIKNCKNPHEKQPYDTSMLKRIVSARCK